MTFDNHHVKNKMPVFRVHSIRWPKKSYDVADALWDKTSNLNADMAVFARYIREWTSDGNALSLVYAGRTLLQARDEAAQFKVKTQMRR